MLATLALLTVPGCGSPDTAITDSGMARWNVLLITLDTTRWDHLACYGHETAITPTLDRLAASGTRFETAMAQAPLTLPSHAAIFTGLNPYRHGARGNGLYTISAEQETMAERLADAGYQTAGVIAAFVLNRRFGLAQGFAAFDDDTSAMRQVSEFQDPSRVAADVTSAALRLADDFGRDDPWFLWAHYFDPHFPYTPPPDMARRFPATREGRYLAEIATMDREIQSLIDGLEARDLFERTVIVVVADHGEGFPGPHDEDSHGFYTYDDTLRIPLIIAAPGALPGARVSQRLARQVDILPTVLDLLEVDAPDDLDGVSLASELGVETATIAGDPAASFAEATAPWFAYGWATTYHLRTDDWKYIDAPTPELYNLKTDPDESVNLAEDEPERSAAMQAELDALLDQTTTGGGRGVSAEERRQLAMLGYTLDAATIDPLRGDDNRQLKDPKDWIDFHKRIKAVDSIYLAGRFDEAIAELRALEQRDPTNTQVHEHLALYHEAAGNLEAAEAALRELTRIRPESATGYDRLADVQSKMAQSWEKDGRRDEAGSKYLEAIGNWKKAVELGILEYDPMMRLAVVHLQQQQFKEAEAMLLRGLAIDAGSFDMHRFLGMALTGQNRLDEARRSFETALSLCGGNVDMEITVRAQIVEACRRLGDNPAAVLHIEAILAARPGHPARPQLEAMLEQIRGK